MNYFVDAKSRHEDGGSSTSVALSAPSAKEALILSGYSLSQGWQMIRVYEVEGCCPWEPRVPVLEITDGPGA